MAATSATAPARSADRGARVREILVTDWGFVLALLVAFRVTLSMIGFILAQHGVVRAPCFMGQPAPVMHTTGLAFELLGVWQRWDACWFESIAANGYPWQSGAVGFPPLYPLLMRLAATFLGSNLTLGGLIVSAAGYVLAMVGILRLVREDFGPGVARRTVVLISCFPTAHYFFLPYAESVFLALIVWTFWFARRGSWLAAGGLALLAGITRSPALLLGLPLAWIAWQQWRSGRRLALAFLVPALPVLSFFAFNGYAKLITGWSYSESLSVWQSVQIPPWEAVARSWRIIQRTGNPIETINLVLLGFATLVLLIGWRKLPFAYTLFLASQLLLIASRSSRISPLSSTSRYLLMLFPLFIILALVLASPGKRTLWLAGSASLLGTLLIFYLFGFFVA
jgi:hypothetical protein